MTALFHNLQTNNASTPLIQYRLRPVLYQRGTGVVLFSFFFWLRVLDKAEYSAFESTLNSSIVSYRIVLVHLIENFH